MAVEREESVLGGNSLHSAAALGKERVIRQILESGRCAVNEGDSALGRTALQWASACGHRSVVSLILNQKHQYVNVNKKSADGLTALMLAAGAGHSEIVRILIDHGADMFAKSRQDYLAVDYARATGAQCCLSLLLQRMELAKKHSSDEV